MGLLAPRHVGSSQTRAWTHVPCSGKQILNHRTTREVPDGYVLNLIKRIYKKHATNIILDGEILKVFLPEIMNRTCILIITIFKNTELQYLANAISQKNKNKSYKTGKGRNKTVIIHWWCDCVGRKYKRICCEYSKVTGYKVNILKINVISI